MNKIIIVSAYMIDLIKSEILKHKTILLGYDFITIDQYFQKQENIQFNSMYKQHIELYKTLKKLNPKNRYASLTSNKFFIDQVYKVVSELKKYKVCVDDIEDEDTKALFKLANEVQFNIDFLHQTNFENVRVLEGNYEYFVDLIFSQNHVEVITLKDLFEELELPYNEPTMQKRVIKCLNLKNEIEYVATTIINEYLNLDKVVVHYTNASYIPLIRQVFDRYHIPFTKKSDSSITLINEMWVASIQYLLKKDNFIALLLDYNLFNIERNQLKLLQEYYDYFETFNHLDHMKSLNLDEIISEEAWLKNPNTTKMLPLLYSKEELIHMQQLEEKVKVIYASIIPLKNELDSLTVKAYFIKVFEYIGKHVTTNSDMLVMNQFKKMVVELQDDLEDEYVLETIQYWINHVSVNNHVSQGVTVTKLGNSLPLKQVGFVVGCDVKNYNQFQVNDGIFNEAMNKMWQDLKDYPNVSNRYQHYLKNMTNLSYDEIYYTYASIGFDGKANELDSSLLNIESSDFSLNYKNEGFEREFKISEASAKNLYLVDNIINTSVTSLQTYNQSPLLYYLKYGLKIKEKTQDGYNAIFKGNLYHHLLQKYVLIYKENYYKKGVQVFNEEVQRYFSFYRALLLDKYTRLYQNDEYEIISTLKVSLAKLEELNDDFKPLLVETPYEYEIKTEDYNINIRGKIDRLDECQIDQYHLVRLIDYKSSQKDFKKDLFNRGIDIQLATYAMVTHKQLFSKSVLLGVFYYILNFKQKTTRISGINFSKIKGSDLSVFSEVMNVKTVTPKGISFNALIENCETIYIESVKRILSGEIGKENDVDYLYFPYPYAFGENPNTLKHYYIEEE